MTTPRWKKALFISLATAVTAGAGFAAWHYFNTPAGYSREVVRQANDLQERIISFDSHVTLPLANRTASMTAWYSLISKPYHHRLTISIFSLCFLPQSGLAFP